jgi:hypothetical protein
MSISRGVSIVISQLTLTFLDLIKTAYNTYNKTIFIKEKLIKLNFINSYKDIYNKFKRSYLNKVSKAYYL